MNNLVRVHGKRFESTIGCWQDVPMELDVLPVGIDYMYFMSVNGGKAEFSFYDHRDDTISVMAKPLDDFGFPSYELARLPGLSFKMGVDVVVEKVIEQLQAAIDNPFGK